MRYITLYAFFLFTLSCLAQGDDKIILRYWNGTTDGKGVTHPMGLKVTADNYFPANAIERVVEASLSGQPPNFYLKKKFQLFFKVENVGPNDVVIYDWAFSAICPVDNMGRSFDANSMVPVITPYIPGDIYLVLKPGEKKQFFSSVTDFYWCLPPTKTSLVNGPEYFQARMTCAAIYGSSSTSNLSKKPGVFNPPFSPPAKAGSGLDPEIEKLIDQHNDYIEKNNNKWAEALKARILEYVKILYPDKVKLVESKLLKPKVPVNEKPGGTSSDGSPSSFGPKSTLSFNGATTEADGECTEAIAMLISKDQSFVLILNNLENSSSYSVNSDFYIGRCTDCLAVQFQDINNGKTYVAISGSVQKTAQGITVDVNVKEMLSFIEEGGTTYRVKGKIVCE